ncbi:MAG TPA: class I SAM-dependent methyltransferase [Egibacteraceae bacterium]|jgi:SAM-dependent methyltransferase|nr:class I SAM-dependent methyltransferase [Egibacteraceae bacterium]
MTTTPSPQEHGPAARRWADALAAWALPEEILAQAPEPPYGFDVGLFARIADDAVTRYTPSRRVALEALPVGGSVLDVGCGGGAASLPLVPPASLLVGVDESPDMLAAFAERAAAQGAGHLLVEGRWPEVADRAPPVDVVVCHNVLYNAPDAGPFLRALNDHARQRVVVELTEEHPVSWMNPYWQHLHGLHRPDGPTASDAAEVARELGYDVAVERWERPWRDHDEEHLVAMVRRRLCVGPERDPEIRTLLDRFPPPGAREVATLWWSPSTAVEWAGVGTASSSG